MKDLPRVVPVETPPPVGADLSALPTDSPPKLPEDWTGVPRRRTQRAMFDRLDWLRTWALVADPRAWLLILLLAAATLGRSGVFRSRWLDLLKPYRRRPAPGRGKPAEAKAPTHPLRDPWFLFLLVVSAAAVSTWIIMTLTATGRTRP